MKRHLVLALISLSLAAVSLVLYSAEPGFPGMHRGPRHLNDAGFDNSHMIGTFGFFRLADELEISDPQLLQLRALFQKNDEKIRSGRQHRKLYKKLSDPDLTEADARKIAAEEGKAVEEAIIGRFQMQQDLRKILSAEQYKKLHAHRRPPMPPMPWRGGHRMPDDIDDEENSPRPGMKNRR